MRTLAHGLPSRPLGAHLAAADALSGGCCWSSSTRAFMVEVYTSVSAGRTVPVARRVRNCVLFNVIVPLYTAVLIERAGYGPVSRSGKK